MMDVRSYNSRLNGSTESETKTFVLYPYLYVCYCLQLTIRSVRDQLGKVIIYLVNNLFEVKTKDTEYNNHIINI